MVLCCTAYREEKLQARELVSKAEMASKRNYTSAIALRYCLKQLIHLILAEQEFITNFFFVTGTQIEDEVSSEQRDQLLKVIFIDESRMLELLGTLCLLKHTILKWLSIIDEYIIQPVRGGVNNYEMLSMVVDVEAAIVSLQSSSPFLVRTITNPNKGLQIALQGSFNGFVDEQLKWIESLRPDIRYIGKWF